MAKITVEHKKWGDGVSQTYAVEVDTSIDLHIDPDKYTPAENLEKAILFTDALVRKTAKEAAERAKGSGYE